MIKDILDLDDGTTIESDVCIVGSGLAGIEAARTLARAGLRVVIAEGGRRRFDPRAQQLNRFVSVGRKLITPDPDIPITTYLAKEMRGESHMRQFGGTSNVWTGKWREFSPMDLENRPHVPNSGWPISHAELLETYREIERDYGFGDFQGFGESTAFSRLGAAVAGSGLQATFHYWDRLPLQPAEHFEAELRNSGRVAIVLGANAVELLPSDNGERISTLLCRSLEGRSLRFSATVFLVAAGGVETPRLLLASRSRDPRGIGNRHDLLGRFFMDHPKIKAGKLLPGRNFGLVPGRCAMYPRPRFQVSFALSDEEQRRHGLLNHIIMFSPKKRDLVHEFYEAWQADDRERFVRDGLEVARRPYQLLESVARRLKGKVQPLKVSFLFEQAPNPDSRLSLSNELDPLGMPKLAIDWRFSDLDERSFPRTIQRLTTAVSESGIGRLDFGDKPPTLDATIDSYHHMGATRMGETPQSGVVDRHCKVFGVENLYLASGSVFPTGHSFGPTLTILAMARRACAGIVRQFQPR